MHFVKKLLKSFLPQSILDQINLQYHLTLAFVGALLYRFPSKGMVVIAVTGTKGKTSTTEFVHAIFEEAGLKTALLNTIRFKVGTESKPNRLKMTMPGRFFVQKFLFDAKKAGVTHAVIEMTSEGAKQSRHRFIEIDALLFTNLTPEHIESHGSFEAYRDAKLKIKEAVNKSKKRPRILAANVDDPNGKLFLEGDVEKKIPYGLTSLSEYTATEKGISFLWKGVHITSKLPGKFNAENILGAAELSYALGIPPEVVKTAIDKLALIPGRAEEINEGQSFLAVVDYAHTPESLTALYETYGKNHPLICVLGNTGGGRDTWKRPEMGKIAERYCKEVILTNEDPYDEDPRKIIEDMSDGMKRAPEIILDRRTAIKEALLRARAGDAVLITGKGTDPYIMGPKGTRKMWSDSRVVRDELLRLAEKNERDTMHI